MTGVALRYDLAANERLQQQIDRIVGLDRRALLDTIGATVASQVRRRVEEEKAGPDGAAWSPWSERHAKTRHGKHSLLEGEGDLLGSIDHQVADDQVEIGSNLIYAATHQFGDDDRNIPARPFLGLSADNETALVEVVEAWLDEVLQ